MLCVTLAGVSPAVESSPSWGPSVQWTETTGAAGPPLSHRALQGTALAPPWGLRTGSDGWHQHLSPWWTGLLLPDRRATEPGSAAGPGREGHGWGADPGLTPPGRHTPGASDLTHITGLLLPQVPLPEPHLLSACRAPSTQDVHSRQLLGQSSRSTDAQSGPACQTHHQTPGVRPTSDPSSDPSPSDPALCSISSRIGGSGGSSLHTSLRTWPKAFWPS